jgi:Chagasin family peptidase inhibitor I42
LANSTQQWLELEIHGHQALIVMDEQLQRSARSRQAFTVDLESTPGSGTIWYYVPISGAPELAQEDRKPSANIGGTLVQTFVFRIGAPGIYLLQFELKRAWENIVRRRISVTVSVSE